ncbi:inosine monophosphate cyclohydrolase [Ktedonosporobacter rubrisoli]|uniref:Inosine monophosphate cyclohydrolase n=1 Tax=Ktedonosporobacter rubrisoli TaxID=2509675 RepID=A0A4P6JSX8_KTERU|nr:IMP cyclohydrolase [Ktedonosporobacter rubrisoli]QBD78352.1 inosine monophosphate cyclohydrolase [Ktedonosporobacter rubrisoli]
MEDVTLTASRNFVKHLKENAYPGRGLVIGRSSLKDAWLMIYWLMGRSAHSRNRRLVAQGSVLRTEPIDISLVEDPSLIIYEAMLELPGIYLISNGDQTQTLYQALKAGKTFDDALAQRAHEPDAPHYTPRISGMLSLQNGQGTATLSILKANPINPEFTDRNTFRPALAQGGLGVGLTTYQGDGNPLPGFQGEPLLLPCSGSAEEVLHTYWEALNAENRIALAVKEIPASGGPGNIVIKNRFGS